MPKPPESPSPLIRILPPGVPEGAATVDGRPVEGQDTEILFRRRLPNSGPREAPEPHTRPFVLCRPRRDRRSTSAGGEQ